MKVVLNGKQEVLTGQMTILELLQLKGIKPNTIVIEYNSEIVRKEDWQDIVIKENDSLEILRFVGGG